MNIINNLFIRKTDSIIKYIKTESNTNIFDFLITGEIISDLIEWKTECSKLKNIYIKLINSNYLCSILPEHNFILNGIYDIKLNLFYIISNLYFTELENLNEEYIIFPKNQVIFSNPLLMSNQELELIKNIENYAKEISGKLLTSQLWKNKTKEEIINHSINFSHTFYSRFSEYKKFFQKIKENYEYY